MIKIKTLQTILGLITNNRHREAAVLIAQAAGDMRLTQQALKVQRVHSRVGYVPARLKALRMTVDAATQGYLNSWRR
jgi:hypothetical protein